MQIPIGTRFGMLTVDSDPMDKARNGRFLPVYVFMCDCGNRTERFLANIKRGKNVKSCGCLQRKEYHCRQCNTEDPTHFYGASKTICKKCKVASEQVRISTSMQLRTNRNSIVKKYHQSSPRNFLKTLLLRVSRDSTTQTARKPGDPRDNLDINLDYLLELWDKQEGKCAITYLPMTHQYRSLYSISIDRIDNAIGHVRGNIQLVCKAVNLAKGPHSNHDIIKLISDIVEAQTTCNT